jgi:hypothetical protein
MEYKKGGAYRDNLEALVACNESLRLNNDKLCDTIHTIRRVIRRMRITGCERNRSAHHDELLCGSLERQITGLRRDLRIKGKWLRVCFVLTVASIYAYFVSLITTGNLLHLVLMFAYMVLVVCLTAWERRQQ